jgi:hypothetical protein
MGRIETYKPIDVPSSPRKAWTTRTEIEKEILKTGE